MLPSFQREVLVVSIQIWECDVGSRKFILSLICDSHLPRCLCQQSPLSSLTITMIDNSAFRVAIISSMIKKTTSCEVGFESVVTDSKTT